jgi:hypothetical protein
MPGKFSAGTRSLLRKVAKKHWLEKSHNHPALAGKRNYDKISRDAISVSLAAPPRRGKLAPASANTRLYRAFFFEWLTPVGPSSLCELAPLDRLCDTRSTPKQDPAQNHATPNRNRNPNGAKLKK